MPPALWGYSVPIQSKSSAITPAPSGYIKSPWSHGPRGVNRPRPGWPIPAPALLAGTPAPYSWPPRPGACILRRGRMVVDIPGAGCMGPGGWCRVYPWAGAIYQPVKVPGIVPGGRPHGGGAFTVYRGRRGRQGGGPPPCPGRGAAVRFNPSVAHIVLIHSDSVNRVTEYDAISSFSEKMG